MGGNTSEVNRLYFYKPQYSQPSFKSIILKSGLDKYIYLESKYILYLLRKLSISVTDFQNLLVFLNILECKK